MSFVNETRILDSGFLELYYGFQSPGSRTPRAKFSHIPNTTSHNFPDSGVAYRERNVELFFFLQTKTNVLATLARMALHV